MEIIIIQEGRRQKTEMMLEDVIINYAKMKKNHVAQMSLHVAERDIEGIAEETVVIDLTRKSATSLEKTLSGFLNLKKIIDRNK